MMDRELHDAMSDPVFDHPYVAIGRTFEQRGYIVQSGHVMVPALRGMLVTAR